MFDARDHGGPEAVAVTIPGPAVGGRIVPGSDVVDTVRALTATPFADLDGEGIAAAAAALRRVQGFVDTCLAAVAQRAAVLHAEGGSAPADEVLARAGRLSARVARQQARRAAILTSLPAMAAGVAAGDITSGYLDALVVAAARLPVEARTALLGRDRELAVVATHTSPEEFAQYLERIVQTIMRPADEAAELDAQRRATRLRFHINRRTGMHVLNGEFHPELGQRLFGLLRAETNRLFSLQSSRPSTDAGEDAVALAPELAARGVHPHLATSAEHLAAFALVGLLTDGEPHPRPMAAEVVVLIDADTLVHGAHEHTVAEWGDGTPVPIGVVRRLACSASIVPLVLDGHSVVLDHGRAKRLASAEQRRALRAMYRTCAWSACDAPFAWCEIHHLREWERGGPTDLGNLVPLCAHHHHRVHHDRWRLVLEPEDRTLMIVRPDGEVDACTGPGLVPRHRSDPEEVARWDMLSV